MLLPPHLTGWYHSHRAVAPTPLPPTDNYTATMTTVYPPAQSVALSVEAVSGITGSVSIACWLVVFTPQIIENFKRGSAEGLSLTFLILWLLGDIFNVLGGILQGVLPTMLILAIYYTFADIVLILQCFYYRAYARKPDAEPHTNGESSNHRHSVPEPEHEPTEDSPLLSRTISDPYPEERRGSFRILAETAYHLSPANPLHSLPPSRPDSSQGRKPFTNGNNGVHTNGTSQAASPNRQSTSSSKFWNRVFRDTVAISIVIFAGIAGYYLAPSRTAHVPDGHNPHVPEHRRPLTFSLSGQIFGYLCAVLYLGSRIPQIWLNYKRKSVEGVAFLFFMFACLGNVTYVVSILAYRPGKVEDGEGYMRYIAVNASWLVGSLGTLFLDIVIFGQFFIYGNGDSDDNLSEGAIMSDDEERPLPPSP
ncbi:hypothetical protein Dda_4231 [Drechslerella dactyloides]|uniref:PQ-loop-domain-containing protein n=1 Tax=Drechslerella dactyloides TaxID=74499 RepID=A0AAD6IZU0_DREDA|nr:hypothetical protein Dda_4231 [Drechslerella dactyloides]